MLALKIANTSLDMPAGQRLRVVMSCPLFDRDRIVRTFSQPFKLPLTPRNRRTMQHVDRFDASTAWGERECQLWLEGGQFDRGELVALGSDSTSVEVAFRNLPLTLMEDLKSVYVNEILETISLPTAIAAQITVVVNPSVSDHYITVGGTEVYAFGTVAGTVAGLLRDALNLLFPGIASVVSNNLVLETSIVNSAGGADWDELQGLSLGGYVTTGQAAMLSYTDHVEAVWSSSVPTHCFPVLHWENLYNGKNAEFLGIVNPVFDGVASPTTNQDKETDWPYTYMPAVKVSYILERIRAVSNISYLAGFFEDNPDAQQIVMISDRTSDKVYKDWTSENKFQYRNGLDNEIVLNKHVPKMTALDFLKMVADGLNLVIDYKEGGLHFTAGLDFVSAPPANWSAYVHPEQFNRVITKPLGVLLEYPLDNDEAYKPTPVQFPAYVVGAGGHRIEMPFRTFSMGLATLDGHGSFRCPHTQRPGKIPAYGQDLATMRPTLLFYRGLRDTSEPEQYAYASSDELAPDGTTVEGGLSFVLDGEYGLVAKMFGKTLLYSDLSEMEITAIVPGSEIYRLKKWANARIYFYHPNGPVTLAIQSVDFDVSGREHDGVVSVRVRGIKEGGT